jgi:hypothetical protein
MPNEDDLPLEEEPTQHIYGFSFCESSLLPQIMSTTGKAIYLDRNNAHDEHSKIHPPTLNHGQLSSISSPSSSSDDHILTVDWDGPNDPENPRKYA